MLEQNPVRPPVLDASAHAEHALPPATGPGFHANPIALARIVVAIVSAAALWFELPEPFPVRLPAGVSVIGIGALVFVGWPIAREAFANLLAQRMTMELSMLIALVAAASIGEYFTALVIAVFVLIAEELEHLTVARGRSALHDLVAFVPPAARVRRGDGIQLVPVATLVPGDLVLVGPGEKIAVDGTVMDGHSTVDQSRITGESMPQEKAPGAIVYAGSINHTGALDIAVGSVGRDTTYGRIIEAVEAAEHMRAPAQRLADRLAGYLVYFSFAAAAATYLVTADVRATISVIIVAGACGIAAGTPLAILGGIGRAARLGAIVKGGVHLETLGKVDTIVLDKTGTLTFGEPALEAIRPAAGIDETGLLAAIAAAEFHSEHPLARAVMDAARERGLALVPPDDFCATPGRGISAQIGGRTWLVGNRRFLEEHSIAVPPPDEAIIGSEILAAEEGVYRGEIVVADRLRPEAAPAMAALARLGIRTVLLSGDVRAVAQKVGATLGIAEVGADMLPQDKHARIRDLTAQGRVVAMVGDGINDAPALSAASIGIAMGSGTDVAKESAAVVLIGNDLAKLVETLEIARKTRAIIWQNFAGTLAVDALGMMLAATGQLDPLLAAFIHVGSEFAFLSNSARLLPAAERWRAPLRRRTVRAPAKALSDHLDAG